MEVTTKFHINLIKNELAKRIQRNNHYSLRSFAKSLDINIGTLSSILNGKRPLTNKTAEKITDKLQWSVEDKKNFLASVKSYKNSNSRDSILNMDHSLNFNSFELSDEMFKVISEWYHFALIELIQSKDFNPDSKWIAKKIGITPTEAKLAFERLAQLGLIVFKNKKWIKTNKSIETKDKRNTNSALKRLQKQFLEKAIIAIEEQDYAKRYNRGMTMSIDETKIELAKEIINNFTKEISKVLVTGKNRKVYQLSISLFGLEQN